MARIRTELVIAATAMILSGITAGAVIWQAKVAADQRTASVWPYVQAGVRRSLGEQPLFEIYLVNYGIGPALFRYFAVRVDGEPVQSWDEFLAALSKDENVQRGGYGETLIYPGRAMRPGETISAFTSSNPVIPELLPVAAWDRLRLTFCYCSIYDQCWLVDGPIAEAHESTRVRACPTEGHFMPPDAEG